MDDILKPIKEHDIESLHYRTKISPQYIKALLKRDFSKFTKVQFLGFVSILEREFGIDLSSYKDEYFTALGTEYEATPEIENFISKKEPATENNKKIIPIIIVILLLISVISYQFLVSGTSQEVVKPLDDTLLKETKAQIEVKKQEVLSRKVEETVQEQNSTISETVDKVIAHKVVILPKRRVWVGFINMKNGKRTQDIIDSAYELNTSKSWLIVFGHGYLDLEYDKELFEYNSRKKLWFMFEDGKLEKIDKEEFKKNNGAKGW
jgi:hypothetical protein